MSNPFYSPLFFRVISLGSWKTKYGLVALDPAIRTFWNHARVSVTSLSKHSERMQHPLTKCATLPPQSTISLTGRHTQMFRRAHNLWRACGWDNARDNWKHVWLVHTQHSSFAQQGMHRRCGGTLLCNSLSISSRNAMREQRHRPVIIIICREKLVHASEIKAEAQSCQATRYLDVILNQLFGKVNGKW